MQTTRIRSFRRSSALLALIGAALLISSGIARAQWVRQPAPPCPVSVFEAGKSGAVTLRVILNGDGTVRNAVLVGSSGDGDLDRLAQQTVMRWKMNPTQVTTADMTEGRAQIIGFRQGRGPRSLAPPGAMPYWTRT